MVPRHLQRLPVDGRRARAAHRLRVGRHPRRPRPDRACARSWPSPTPITTATSAAATTARPRAGSPSGCRPASGPCSTRPRRSGGCAGPTTATTRRASGSRGRRPLPVARGLADHERIGWAGGTAGGHPDARATRRGPSASSPTIDGAPVAFTGDLIAGHGRVPTLHDLQWQYGMPDAVGAGAALRDARWPRRGPRRLLPSHGAPIDDGQAALRALAGNLRQLARLLGGDPTQSTLDDLAEQRGPAARPTSCPTCGSTPTAWPTPTRSSMTPATRSSSTTASRRGTTTSRTSASSRTPSTSSGPRPASRRVVAAIPSHYHDDHLAGVPWLQREHGAQAWIHDSFAGHRVASRIATTCHASGRSRSAWTACSPTATSWSMPARGCETFHMPGHTMFALGLAGHAGRRPRRLHRRQPAGRGA